MKRLKKLTISDLVALRSYVREQTDDLTFMVEKGDISEEEKENFSKKILSLGFLNERIEEILDEITEELINVL